MKKSNVERMVERLRAEGHSRHSDAYRWLRENGRVPSSQRTLSADSLAALLAFYEREGMKKMPIHERLAREVKNELNRFLNWPPVQNVSLGMVGRWDGKRATFTPETDLSTLGMTFAPDNQLDLRHDDLYSSAGAVSIEFKADSKNLRSKADLTFSTKHALLSQCFQTRYEQVNLIQLLAELRNNFRMRSRNRNAFVGTGNQDWDRDWLIVTAVWVPSNYTLLVSGARDARVTLGAKTNDATFNLADATVSVTAEVVHKAAYQLVAAQAARPFFVAHRVMEHSERLGLKPYGSEGLRGLLV